MKLIVISHPNSDLYYEVETILGLFNYGLSYFHLRKPNFSELEYEKLLNKIPEQHRNKIIIHNYHNLAIKYHLKGIHYSSYTQVSDINQNMQKSKSCHSLAEITKISNLYDYVFLSPIYDSISKLGYQANFNKQDLRKFLINRNKLPEVIALGGIELDKLEEVKYLGFAGIAILGTIWQEKTIEQRLDKFINIKKYISFPY